MIVVREMAVTENEPNHLSVTKCNSKRRRKSSNVVMWWWWRHSVNAVA